MFGRSARRAATDRVMCYVLGGILGALLALNCLAAFRLSLDPSVTAGNILQASATVFTGLFVAVFVQRLLKADEREKDFLIRQLDLLASHAAELHSSEGERPLTEVTAILKKIRIGANAIFEIVKALDRRGLAVGDFDFADDIKELRTLTTDTPIRGIKEHMPKSRAKAEVKEGMIKLVEGFEAELETKIQGFSHRILVAQVAVIKA